MVGWKSTETAHRIRRARKSARTTQKGMLLAAGIGMGLTAVRYAIRRRNNFDLLGRVVVVTGGSRGLGLALAEECARQGAVLAICARDRAELETARDLLQRFYHTAVFADVCDVSNNDDVVGFLTGVLSRFGRIDVLINNAGVISVGPIESQTLADFEEAMDVMFWGVVYPTLCVLPHMRARRFGRIANITSFGGKLAVPHLVPYGAAKFAAVGFSEGMRSELLKDRILVTTVCPGLIRTGSHLNAYFKGDNRSEFTWFSFGASTPLLSIDAHRAARKIVAAIRAGDAELILTPQAKLATAFHGLFPGLTTDIAGLVNMLLPRAVGRSRHRGAESQTWLTRSFLQHFGQQAARELNQLRNVS